MESASSYKSIPTVDYASGGVFDDPTSSAASDDHIATGKSWDLEEGNPSCELVRVKANENSTTADKNGCNIMPATNENKKHFVKLIPKPRQKTKLEREVEAAEKARQDFWTCCLMHSFLPCGCLCALPMVQEHPDRGTCFQPSSSACHGYFTAVGIGAVLFIIASFLQN